MTGKAAAWTARWPQVVAAGLSLMALTSVWKTAPAHIGAAVALLGATLSVVYGNRPRWDAVNLVAALLLAWLLLRLALQLLAGCAQPGLVAPVSGFLEWVWPLAFAPLAVDGSHGTRRVMQLWALGMAGFAAGVLSYFATQGLDPLLRGDRLGFHLNRPLGVGLYAGAFLLAVLFTAQLWWRARWSRPWLVRAILVLFAALCLLVLHASQNRSTWLGLIVVGSGAVGLVGLKALRKTIPRRLLPLTAMGLTLAVVIGWLALTAMETRTSTERDAISMVIQGGLDAAPATPITIRLRLWKFVSDQFGGAPWIGHGFGGFQEVLKTELRGGAPLLEGELQDHVHSTYLQTLYGQGLVGCALWSLLGIFLVRDLVRAARDRPEVAAVLPATWAVLGFVAIWALTDYRLSHPDMRFFSILLLLSLRLLGGVQPPRSSAR